LEQLDLISLAASPIARKDQQTSYVTSGKIKIQPSQAITKKQASSKQSGKHQASNQSDNWPSI
jgi:hypothetical protein